MLLNFGMMSRSSTQCNVPATGATMSPVASAKQRRDLTAVLVDLTQPTGQIEPDDAC